ncbi:MAG: hypothetical protein ABSE62_12765 [Chthoniobacteraceae bacterium]|jgi:hypothetical protein
MKSFAVAVLFLALTASTGLYARAIRYWLPDELCERSSLVCDGMVLDVTPREFKEEKKNNGNTLPVRVYSAKVKVLSVLKGKPVDTLEMRFEVRDTRGMVTDGPREISLKEGEKYRFYLNQDANKNCYWGYLQGELDDAQSVGPILIPDSQEDAGLRIHEIDRDRGRLNESLISTFRLQGSPGFETARNEELSRWLQLFLKCESLKKAKTDQAYLKRFEVRIIQDLVRMKEFFWSR